MKHFGKRDKLLSKTPTILRVLKTRSVIREMTAVPSAPSSDMPGVGHCRSWEHRHETLPVICFLEGGLRVLHRATV